MSKSVAHAGDIDFQSVGTIAIVSPSGSATGNRSTSFRIALGLRRVGFDCILVSPNDIVDVSWVSKHNVVAVLGLHGYHTGKHLPQCGVPYAIIFGGTDIASDVFTTGTNFVLQTKAIAGAKELVAFSSAMSDRAHRLWPSLATPIRIIPQAVEDIIHDPDFDFVELLETHCGATTPPWSAQNVQVFLHPTGLRPVKDVLFVASAFSQWHLSHPNARLAIIGPVVDDAYGERVVTTVKTLPGVYVVASVPQAQLFSAMMSSVAVINTSIAEGMCGVILEAMKLGTVVIARNIPENAACVTHMVDGLLFDTPTDFVGMCDRLATDTTLKSSLVSAAKDRSERYHSLTVEQEAYTRVVKHLLLKE
eukprot:m.284321 g.284321  ORF g.284321 m.284321 type:complete len:363 (+) comp172508_c0_seq1:146-1234(+)